MRLPSKYKLFGSVLSDGSFKFLLLPAYNIQQSLKVKNSDIFNQAVWTGRRPKKQTEISSFIDRFALDLKDNKNLF